MHTNNLTTVSFVRTHYQTRT